MMKRLLAFMLCIVLLCSGCAGGKNAAEEILLYYMAEDISLTGGDVLRTEVYQPDGEADIDALAAQYFSGPTEEGIVSPFPRDTVLRSYRVSDGCLQLTLSKALANLSKADLSLALTCIAKTFLQLDAIESVEIFAHESLLNGQNSVKIRENQLLTKDNTAELMENTLCIYYADKDQRYLLAHEVKTKLDSVSDQAAFALTELLSAPSNTQLRATLPAGTEILDIQIDGGVCSVDFSEEFFRNRPQGDMGERITLLSIVNTLTEFEEIESVQFFVEGEVLAHYHNAALNISYTRDESAIGPVRYAANESDGTIYLIRESDRSLVQTPVRLKPAANESEADALVHALIDFSAKNGVYSPLPANTEILSLEVNGEYCHIDLSEAFADALADAAAEEAAIEALVRSLKTVGEISRVSILIEGQQSGLSHVDLSQVF